MREVGGREHKRHGLGALAASISELIGCGTSFAGFLVEGKRRGEAKLLCLF
jgi:hypothetical protein